jgi:hypothetical protein
LLVPQRGHVVRGAGGEPLAPRASGGRGAKVKSGADGRVE